MDHVRPPGAPSCWGTTFQSGDIECRQCRFRNECEQEMHYKLTRPSPLVPIRGYTPSTPPVSSVPDRPALPPPPAATTVMPLPSRAYFAPPTQSIPLPPRPTTPPATVTSQPAPQTQPNYYQASTGFSLPNPTVQNPMNPWHRPGAPAPSYYFVQHPGEGTGTRLAKNAVLRALEAIFAELMQFFRHWTWPPGQKK